MGWLDLIGAGDGKDRSNDSSDSQSALEKQILKQIKDLQARLKQQQAAQVASGKDSLATAEEGYAWEMNELTASNTAWDAMYGSVEKNLSDYYKTATPETLGAAGMRDQAVIHTEQVQKLQQRAAISGIDSPANDMMLANEDIRFAESKAEVKNQAGKDFREGSSNFLTLGMNLRASKDQAKTGVRNARTNVQLAQAGMASIYGQQAGQTMEQYNTALRLAQEQQRIDAELEAERLRNQNNSGGSSSGSNTTIYNDPDPSDSWI